jgi:lipopolysaccharide/colanic/teichoic acid biosynthesis glycosyltransferase
MPKRFVDIIVSVITLILLSPIFVFVGILLRRDTPGPILYRGVRAGMHNREFRMLKFRTMVSNASEIGGPNTPRDDPRITRTGRYLRKFNIDELPQFINVLRGEMSIVGPRPEVPEYVAKFTNEEKDKLLSVRPGITDLATLWVRDEGAILDGSDDPEKTYMDVIWTRKHELQMKYVNERSMVLDLKIMMWTLKSHLVDRVWGQN